ncbi:hypothetical protein D9756_010422 [Leucocoprinus leucothites]|uniref:Uncharacterized protein n=1 Tax=Leucocoprinus leucothites TaxID=201217 RepID=A0A8H5CRK7_9AGAR|nr:hypothetical protein D9756_010422 [Leucoagaricus leucothites]
MSELLQTFLSRASGALLNLNLDWEEEDLLSGSTNPDLMHPTDPLLRSVLIKHPSRFRSLKMAWKLPRSYFNHLCTSFTSLVELHIKFVPNDIDKLIPATFFLQLTSLHLMSVTISVCLTLLSQSPNLMQFHCGYIVRESISDIMKRPMVMSEKLEWFDWKSPDAELSDVAVLKRSRFPQLKKLTWDALNTEYEFSQYLSDFIDFIPSKLIHLELVMKDGCANSVRRILASNPQIKKLSLIGSTLDLPPFFPPFLDCFESLPTVRALYLETDDEAFSDTTKERLRKLIRDGREVVIRAGEELVDLNSEHY